MCIANTWIADEFKLLQLITNIIFWIWYKLLDYNGNGQTTKHETVCCD